MNLDEGNNKPVAGIQIVRSCDASEGRKGEEMRGGTLHSLLSICPPFLS